MPVPFPPLLLYSLGCVLPQCVFVEKSAKVFPGHLGRGVSPGAGPSLPSSGTPPAVTSTASTADGTKPTSSPIRKIHMQL